MKCSKFAARFILLACAFTFHLLQSAAAADWRGERIVGPGAKHFFIRQEKGPWEVNILEASREEPGLFLGTALAKGMILGNAPLSMMVPSASVASPYILAALNGDYFRRSPDSYAGDPLGLHILQGELISFPHPARSALLITSDQQVLIQRLSISAWAVSSRGVRHVIHGLNQPREAQRLALYTPRVGPRTLTNPYGVEVLLRPSQIRLTPGSEIKAQVMAIVTDGDSQIPPDRMVLSGHGIAAWFLRQLEQGEEITLTMRLEPQVAEIVEAIGGGPRLLKEGRIALEEEKQSFSPEFISRRHPRSAVGFSENSLFLVTVDGRRPGRSEGMTLYEMADLLLSLGCKEALNLDGGGSTEMLVRGKLANSPSDGAERPVANALLLFSSTPAGILASLRLEPSRVSLLATDELRLRLRGQDHYFKRVEVPLQQVSWKVSPAVGKVGSDGVFIITEKVERPLLVEIEARIGEISGKGQVQVFPFPVGLEIVPGRISLRAGQPQQFIVEGKRADGTPIPALLLRPAWSCSSEVGEIDHRGYFRAGQNRAEGIVTARLACPPSGRRGEATAQARVYVEPAKQE